MTRRQAFRRGPLRMLGGLVLRGLVFGALVGSPALLGAAGGAVAAEVRAAPAALASTAVAPAAAASGPRGEVLAADGDLDDFTFNSFNGDYTLGRDGEGHSTLTTVETFDAQFPDFDRNRGFIRAIPEKYDGHPTDLTLVSVTDGSGASRPYSIDSEDGLLLVTLAGDAFVRGQQTYVLTFTQKYVTDFFADTNDDEFYWDTIGTAAKQPVLSATASVHVPADLVPSLTGSTACYYGPAGSTNRCELATAPGASGTDFQVAPRALAAGENVSVVVGFAPGTFTARDGSFFASGAAIASLVLAVIALLIVALAIVNRVTRLRDAPGRPTIIAEYTPPRGVNLLLASIIAKKTPRGAAAVFVDLAVRRNIQIVEQPPTGRGASTYWLRLLTAQGLDAAERELATLLFGDTLVSGAWKQLEKRDVALAKGISALQASVRKSSEADGYYRTAGTHALSFLCLGGVLVAAVGIFLTGGVAVNGDYGGGWPYVLFAVAVLSVIVVFAVSFRRPLTAKGAELRDHIEGLELYIRLAEQDRFAMLQSPEGALKTQVSAPDRGQVVRIYEKLLPYAVLLNLEKEWSQVLGTYYESLGSQPDWYGGNVGMFNAALFASSIGSLSSSVSTSLASSTASSSSGGSGGGGFSGGGGGGGGTSGV
ncbi:DUF2207 domain-containing protein [Subtercola boreus]|uniref:DUF2207 domain-containing protein n=1 Tax=Subtercola boreus TaxID=120213 RepID=UPI0014727B5E|nr:DUF2207 domain-containing protein [Subtercola boreus]